MLLWIINFVHICSFLIIVSLSLLPNKTDYLKLKIYNVQKLLVQLLELTLISPVLAEEMTCTENIYLYLPSRKALILRKPKKEIKREGMWLSVCLGHCQVSLLRGKMCTENADDWRAEKSGCRSRPPCTKHSFSN